MATEITETQFAGMVLESSDPILVDFFATWCGPCKMMAPVLDEISEAVEPAAHVYKVDIDQCRDLAAQYRVMSVPTMIIFKDGQPYQQFIGVQSKDTMIDAIQKAVQTA